MARIVKELPDQAEVEPVAVVLPQLQQLQTRVVVVVAVRQQLVIEMERTVVLALLLFATGSNNSN